ncbi:uncharacterized protein isoform X2 [Leptinotarsa decemlineata]|uniref:uncharacterized protein isoform X2 n=1 Tax=Leptinotarsa decemlineata TaxID=7539 RepID=UPI003D30B820
MHYYCSDHQIEHIVVSRAAQICELFHKQIKMTETTPSIFLAAESVQLCSICHGYLSVGPISISYNEPVCGRCRPLPECTATFYENIAKYMFFPCINDRYGCDIMLPWKAVSSHEKKCTFFPVTCPALKCIQDIRKEDIVKHFEESHEKLITNIGPFHVTVHDVPVNKLLRWEEKTFILKISFSSQKWYFEISSWEKSESAKLKYEISLDGDENVNGSSTVCGSISTYQEKQHQTSTILEVNHVKSFQRGTIKIEKESLSNPLLNKELLSELECPICTFYMRPPIFMCVAGHSFCDSCKVNLMKCPLCQSEMKDNRNFVLERITKHIFFPCKNECSGCDIVDRLPKMIIHEKTCQLEPECFLTYSVPCSWRGRQSEIVSHLSESHPEFYINLNLPIVLNLKHSETIIAFTEYDKCIFKVHINWDELAGLNVCVKLVSDRQKHSYRYFLNCKDRNENHRYMSMNKFCPVTRPEDDTLDNCLSLKKQMMKPFSKNDMFEIKIYIVEI